MEKSSSGFNDRLEEQNQSDKKSEGHSQGGVMEELVEVEQTANVTDQ